MEQVSGYIKAKGSKLINGGDGSEIILRGG